MASGNDEGSGKRATLDLLLSPRSIAIVGASSDPRTIRGRLLEYLVQREFAGRLYLVSPTQAEIRGLKTFAGLSSIGEPIDLVLIATRADATTAIVEECAELGVGFAICYSSGFAEAGAQGAAEQQRLAEVVRKSSLRICGPNTAGFYNVRDNLPATFARNVDLRRAQVAKLRKGQGKIAVIAQSGGLGFALTDRCAKEHGLAVNLVISTGNEADLGTLDFVEHVIGDTGTEVILLLVEAIKEAGRLPQIARRALKAGKPIIVSKFGKTDAGARAVSSHAGRLTGSAEAYDATFARLGMIASDDEEEIADLAAAFSLYPPPAGNRVGILTTSGGAGVWMADACEAAGLNIPILDHSTQTRLASFVPHFGATQNPVDLTAQVTVNPLGVEAESPLVGALRALHDCDAIDAIILIANMSDGEVLAREQEGLSALAGRLRKPLFLYSHAPASPASLELAQEIGLSVFASTHRAARALSAMVRYAKARAGAQSDDDHRPPIPIDPLDVKALAGGLVEYKAKALLARYGFPACEEVLAQSAEAAIAAARQYDAPVALKIQSEDIPHKSEVGGVALGLTGDEAISGAYDAILTAARKARPQAVLDGVLVQKMLKPGTEFALGVMRDPDLGPMMIVGLGGIFIEVLKDVAIEPLPVRQDQALAMLRRLRAWPILEGVRGQAPLDVGALVSLMERLSLVAEASGDAICEIDLNPVFLYPQGEGVAIADALIIGRNGPSGGGGLK